VPAPPPKRPTLLDNLRDYMPRLPKM
jgi:hypothetical protein